MVFTDNKTVTLLLLTASCMVDVVYAGGEIQGPSKGAVAGIMIGIFVGLAIVTYICAQMQMKKQEERLEQRAAEKAELDKLEEEVKDLENGGKEVDDHFDNTGSIAYDPSHIKYAKPEMTESVRSTAEA